MSIVTERLTRDRFRELYADVKPNVEVIDGVAEQKAMGSKPHAYLQAIVARMLQDCGFRAATELTLAISETWDPVPDVTGVLGPDTDELYHSQPPAVVIEILSPSDRFTLLDQKCRQYAEWGILDILVFDPLSERVWCWDRTTDSLLYRISDRYMFASKPDTKLQLDEVFRRLRAALGRH